MNLLFSKLIIFILPTQISIEPEYYRNPNTKNDIYVHCCGTPWCSKLYYTDNKPLKYRAAEFFKEERQSPEIEDFKIPLLQMGLLNEK